MATLLRPYHNQSASSPLLRPKVVCQLGIIIIVHNQATFRLWLRRGEPAALQCGVGQMPLSHCLQ